MSTFIDQLCDYLLESGNAAETTIVLPNKRAGLFFRESYQKRLDKPAFMPKIYGIESFISGITGLQLAGNVDLLFRFYKVYLHLNKDEGQSFSDFMNWGQILLHDFNEIDQQLVETNELFSYLQDIRDLEAWGKAEINTTSPLQINFNRFWKNVGIYYLELKSELLDNNLSYSGLASRVAVEKLKKGENLELDGNHLIFAGFSALTEAETYLIEYLRSEKKAEVLWDADEYYTDNPAQEAGMFFRKRSGLLQTGEFKWKQYKLTGERKKISIIGVPQQSGQAKMTGQLIQDPAYAGSQTAVVLADENMLSPLLQSLPNNIDSVNVTMGFPLKNAPLHDFINELIELFVRKKSDAFYHQQFIRLMDNRYFGILTKTKANLELIEAFAKEVTKKNNVFITVTTGNDEFNAIPIVKALFEVSSVSSLLVFIRACILRLKEYFIESKPFNYRIEMEHLLAFHQLFNRITELREEYPYLENYKTLQVLFHQLLNNHTVDFEGEPLEGLQVMGMLETRNLEFERVILLSANEGILPLGKTQNSFIPYDVKYKYNLPTHREKDAVFAYHFYHLIQGAKEVSILYNTEPDEFGSGEKSRFVTQIEEELRNFDNVTIEHKVAETPLGKPNTESKQIRKNPEILERIKKKLKSGISPTSMSTFLNCPLDFYYKYLLGISEEDKVEKDIEAGSLGSALHDTIEKLYLPFAGKEIHEVDINGMLKSFPLILRNSFSENFDISALERGQNLLTLKVAEKYLETYLKKELKKIKKYGPISLFAAEKTLKTELQVNLGEEIIPVTIKGKVDRIDRTKTGLKIIDYKTGAVSKSEVTLNSTEEIILPKYLGKALQLMTYAYLCHQNHPGNSFSSGIDSFRSIGSDTYQLKIDGDSSLKESTFKEFEACLRQIVGDMLDDQKQFEHNPDSVYCDFCGQ